MKPQKQSRQRAGLSVIGIMLFFAFIYTTKRQLVLHALPKPNGLEVIALQLNEKDPQVVCKEKTVEQRKFVTKVLDRYSDKISKLRADFKPAAENLNDAQAFGPIYIRKNKEQKLPHFDQTVWSWSDAFVQLQKTQEKGADKNLWVSVDNTARFLLEQDQKRVFRNLPFLPPSKTHWIFRPRGFLQRKSSHQWILKVDAGDLEKQKIELKKILEKTWSVGGRHLQVVWVDGKKEQAYRFIADLTTTKSYTDHSTKEIHLKRVIGPSVIAHELGHVLGFDDHYYEVWHEEYCYYTQEFDTTDIMSDAENGKVSEKHWQIIELAYPKGQPAQNFEYQFTDS